MSLQRIAPNITPPLDPDYKPAVLANRSFRQAVVEAGGGSALIFGLERADGSVSRFETAVFSGDHRRAEENLYYAERLLKFLLWQRGGGKVYIGGSTAIGEYLKRVYSSQGDRAFDYHFMGEKVYLTPFEIVACSAEEVPPRNESGQALGRHLSGYRIGFDLGASDVKVSAVVDGTAIYSNEIVWEPVIQTDPAYHYQRVTAALKEAAAQMPQVDAIGGSSAGVYVNNQPRVASLFRGIPDDCFDAIRTMFLRIRDEYAVPLEVVNDGEVTALAGSMSLEDNGILGVAMGSSEAAGYVNMNGNITGWLNELAFAPVDYNPEAPVDEWSGDKGVGALYFSQQCVFRLAPKVGIEAVGETKAAKLKSVQSYLESGHEGARQIWESIGIYLGYTLAHYADFYDLRHVLVLGRVTSGRGGPLILDNAKKVLAAEFPELSHINIQLPDEKSRRVGQSIAAASLPDLQSADIN